MFSCIFLNFGALQHFINVHPNILLLIFFCFLLFFHNLVSANHVVSIVIINKAHVGMEPPVLGPVTAHVPVPPHVHAPPPPAQAHPPSSVATPPPAHAPPPPTHAPPPPASAPPPPLPTQAPPPPATASSSASPLVQQASVPGVSMQEYFLLHTTQCTPGMQKLGCVSISAALIMESQSKSATMHRENQGASLRCVPLSSEVQQIHTRHMQ